MAQVRVIPATKQKHSIKGALLTAKRRTAAYARVSTDSDEQLTSYEAQVDYYTRYINERADWEFVRVYTDEGISATSTKRREGFNQMVTDALDGKIDLIITKSVSRFARNTVDSLVTVRQLKEKGVEVYFEKENIYTLDSKGELLITIMSSLAQEESRSISENVTWGRRKQMADGKITLPYSRFLGYEKGEDGLPKIVESEAAIIRMIFTLFMDGKTPSAIARLLTSQGIPTPAGKKNWQMAVIISILTNEKYKGDALLQKRFTVDFLTKTRKVNEGEVPQYYVQNSHPAIIDPDEFDAVQAEMERRKALGRPYRCDSPFSSRIVCGGCGAFFGSKVWSSTSKYRRIIWRCNDKYKKGQLCLSTHVTEDEIRQGFLQAFNQLMGSRDELLANCRLAQQVVCDCTELDQEIARVSGEMDALSEQTRNHIYENARTVINQEEFTEKYQELMRQYQQSRELLSELETARARRRDRHKRLEAFIQDMESRPLVQTEFNEKLWISVIDRVTVQVNNCLEFTFKDGTCVSVEP